MKTIMEIISVTCLLSSLICGLWIKYSGKADKSSVELHMMLGILTVVLSIITLLFFRK